MDKTYRVTFYHRLDGAYHNNEFNKPLDILISQFKNKVDNLYIYECLPNNKKKRVFNYNTDWHNSINMQ